MKTAVLLDVTDDADEIAAFDAKTGKLFMLPLNQYSAKTGKRLTTPSTQHVTVIDDSERPDPPHIIFTEYGCRPDYRLVMLANGREVWVNKKYIKRPGTKVHFREGRKLLKHFVRVAITSNRVP